MKLKILELDEELFKYYKTCTKGNENITKDQARRKLTRNIQLAMKVPPRNKLDRLKGNEMYFFGNLHICCRGDTIVHINNHYNGAHFGGWFLDKEKHAELTKQLGIVD